MALGDSRTFVRPVTLEQANAFIKAHHRHNKPAHRCRYSIGLFIAAAADFFGAERLVAVVMVGRPLARMLDDGVTAEVVRLCTNDWAPPGACSKLYRAAWRAWAAMGGRRMVTYTLQAECGASLRGAGWVQSEKLRARTGLAWCNRSGREDQDVVRQPKIRWEICNGTR